MALWSHIPCPLTTSFRATSIYWSQTLHDPRLQPLSHRPTDHPADTQDTPLTVDELSQQRYYLTNPVSKRVEEAGLASLTPAERQTWANAQLLPRVSARKTVLPAKVEREYWKQVAKDNVPIRALARDYHWGRDKNDREVGGYLPEQFEVRRRKEDRLAVLRVEHERFLARRELRDSGFSGRKGRSYEITEEDIRLEKERRGEMAALNAELYGERSGPYANDPEWDDVVPIPAEEPEGALAAIAYPDDYAEGTIPWMFSQRD